MTKKKQIKKYVRMLDDFMCPESIINKFKEEIEAIPDGDRFLIKAETLFNKYRDYTLNEVYARI